MVQMKSNSRRQSPVQRFIAAIRCTRTMMPWLAQTLRDLGSTATGFQPRLRSHLAAMRETRINPAPRRAAAQGHAYLIESLEPRVYLSANSIGIQFVGSGTALIASQTAGVVQQDNWNGLTGSTWSNQSLVNNSGSATAVTISGKTSGFYVATGMKDGVPGDADLTSGELFNYGTLANSLSQNDVLTLSNIPFATYDVYVTSSMDAPGRNVTLELTPSGGSASYASFITNDNGATSWTAATSNWNGAGTLPTLPAANYAEFTEQTAGSFSLSFGSANSNGGINSIQIVAVPPAAPANVTAAMVSSSQINLSWNAVPGATGYNIYSATTPGGENYSTPLNGSSPITTTSFSDTGLSANTTYYYTVEAVNTIGSSPASSEASIATAALPNGWSDQNIGGVTGSASYTPSTSSWSIQTGSGYIGSGSDEFNFAGTTLAGDGSVAAEITGISQTSDSAKTGIMIRDTSSASSAFMSIGYNHNDGIFVMYRSAAGDNALLDGQVSEAFSGSLYLKLTRLGDSYTAFYSTNGVNYTQLGNPVAMAFTSQNSLAGLATCGYGSGTDTSTFSNVSVTDPSLPAGYTDQDIGSPAYAGSAAYSSGTWTISGSGGGITNLSDQFNLAGQTLTGDAAAVAQIDTLSALNGGAQTGVMFRDSNSAGSMFAAVVNTQGDGLQFIWRNGTGLQMQSASVTGLSGPVWVKLIKVNDSYSGYYSTNGTSWTQIGTTESFAFTNSSYLGGLVASADNNSAIATATLTNVSIGPAQSAPQAITGVTATANGAGSISLSWTDSNTSATETNINILRSTDGVNYTPVGTVAAGTTTYTDNLLSADTQYYYEIQAENAGNDAAASAAVNATTAAATLPTPWNSGSVGGVTGTESISSGSYSITSTGEIAPAVSAYYYVGAGSDSFSGIYQALGNNQQIIAQANSISNLYEGRAQAGLMVRADGDSGAAFAGLFITPDLGVEFLSRSAYGVNAVMQADISYAPPTSGAPVYLMLTTVSGVTTGYISVDGTNWSQIGQATVNLGASPVVGLVEASNSSTTDSATFSNVVINATPSSFNVVPQTAQSIHTEVYSGSDGRIDWRPIPNATSITVQQSTDGGTTWNTVGSNIPGTADTWLPTGLMPNTTYSYRIQASNANGSSPWSPVVTLTTAASTSWGLYQVSPGEWNPGYPDDVLTLTATQSYVYADSWQQAFFRGVSGVEGNAAIGLTSPVGNFALASSGQGYYGNSYGILTSNITSDPSYSLPNNVISINNTALEYYYTGYQNDQSSSGQQSDGISKGNTHTPTHPCPHPCPCPPKSSRHPVNYYDGAPEVTSPGLSSTGFDANFGVNLNWTTMTVYTPNSNYGNGWSNSVVDGTYLVDNGGASSQKPSVMVVNDAYNQDVFNYNSSTGLYQGSAMTTNTLTHNADGTYTMTTEAGNSFEYYDFASTTPAYLQGKLIAATDSAGNQTQWAYNGSGQITSVTQTDAASDVETFAYTYITTGINAGKVSLITQTIQQAGQAATLYRQMALAYYDGSYSGNMQYGNAGDLQSVTIEDANGNIINQSIYRYYTPAEISDGAQGFAGGLQYVFNYSAIAAANESLAAYNAANSTSFSLLNAPATLVAPYADNYFQYNSNHQVTLETFGSGGSTATNGLGTQTFSYYQNPQFVVGDNYNTWFTRTTQTMQDGGQQIVYTNVNGNELMAIDVSSAGAITSLTAYTFDSDGRTLETINPSAINLSYNGLNLATSLADMENALEFNSGKSVADLGISEGLVYTNQGLINSSSYYTSTTATTSNAGGVAGYTKADYVQQGSSGTAIEQDSYTYIEHLDFNGNTIFPEASYTQYQSAVGNGSTPETTDYSYSWQSNSSGQATNQIEDQTTTNPVAIAAQNGSGTATSTQTVYNTFGQPVWTMDAAGYITYTAYDNATGAVIQTVQDVNTANLSDLENYSGTYPGGTLAFGSNGYNQLGVPQLPPGWATPAGGGLNLVTSYKVDDLGRPTEIISPNGNISYLMYDDANHAVFTMTGVTGNLDSNGNGTATATGPITMTRSQIPYGYTTNGQNLEGLYDETITFSGTLTVVGGVVQLPGFNGNGTLNLIGNGTIANPQFTIQSLSRTLYNNSGRTEGQMVESDAYANITDAVYLATATNSPYCGTMITNQLSGKVPNGNYYATYYGYDADGRQYQIIDANGTVNDTVYDSLGRVVSDWVGTNDTTSNGQPFTGSNAGSGNNMTEVTSYVYDNGGVGDSNATEVIQYPDGNTAGTQRVSLLDYNFRDQLVATETGLTLNSSGQPVTSSSDPYPQITVSTLDNLGDVLSTGTFNGGATTIANAITAIATAAPGAVVAGLIGYTTTEYDSQNRAYENQTYSVDPSTGTISTTALTSYTFYGPRGNVIEAIAPTGQVTKNVYNGVDELVDTYTTDGGAVNNGGTPLMSYSAAGSVANDVVVQQTAYGYDGDGNLIETASAQRDNTDPITGASAEGSLFTDTVNSDGSLVVTPASESNPNLGARISYSATYYDAADREIATVDAGTNPVGTNGAATPWSRPANAPASVTDSNFAGDLITLTSYNPAGEVYETTDSNGNVAANFYNSLGEATETIAAYNPSVNGGNPTNDQNQTTL